MRHLWLALVATVGGLVGRLLSGFDDAKHEDVDQMARRDAKLRRLAQEAKHQTKTYKVGGKDLT